MSKFEWNPQQEKAITSKGKGIVVSAAAGSGKTAVLVERIIKRVCDKDDSACFERLLVVTFTRAAAEEMNQRLRLKLAEVIEDNPGNKYILKQKRLLPLANISSIDSYLNTIVKEFSHKLGVSPDFRICDDTEKKLLIDEAVSEAVEGFYEEDKPEFKALTDLIGNDSDDHSLGEIVKKLNTYADSHVSPEGWLDSIAESYSGNMPVSETGFGRIVLDHIIDTEKYAIELYDKALEQVAGYEGFEVIESLLKGERELAARGLSLAEGGQWDALKAELEADYSCFATFSTKGMSSEHKNSDEKKIAYALRERAKSAIRSLYDVIEADSSQYAEDMTKLCPVVGELIRLVKEFRRVFTQKKSELNILDFNDITHLAIKLLINDDGTPSEVALELRGRYDEILIDEYQDTNEAQDAIFMAISNDKRNLFLVGDVKQSVYGFRLATPYMFIDKINTWKRKDVDYAQYINLDENYRSRKEILYSVNYLFAKIMSEKVGDIVYDEAEALKPGFKDFPEAKEPRVEIDLVEKPQKSGNITETDFVAMRIRQLLENGSVYDKKQKRERPVRLGDICILARTNPLCEKFAGELNSKGISAHYEVKNGFFKCLEIKTMIALLEILDNPLQDIPLITVLSSPLAGFSPDDLARLRIAKRYGNIYYALKESEEPKCKEFIRMYNELRSLASVMSVSSLIREIYERTGYYSVAGALTNGEGRQMNLLLLIDYASSYESYSSQGLAGFVRYLDRCRELNTDLERASGISENADTVKVMTIHKSKGLEFPIVFLVGTAAPKRNYSNKLVIDETAGAGLKICEREQFKTYSTVQFRAASIVNRNRELSEELRLLYVAMTRAMDMLIITAQLANAAKRIGDVGYTGLLKKLNPVEVAGTNSFIDLIFKAFITHKDMTDMRNAVGYELKYDKESDFSLALNVININEEDAVEPEISDTDNSVPEADPKTVELIRQRAEYTYPYGSLATLATKKSASSFNVDSGDTLRYFADSVPRFARDGKLTGAQKGTAMHRFMEVSDFSLAEADVAAERDRLVSEKLLTPEQAQVLDLNALRGFFSSNVYSRMNKSDRVMREQKFTVFVPALFVNPELGEAAGGEKVLVQGVIDCAFFEDGKIVVLDYKTDRVNDADELKQMYHRQLEVYKLAAEESFDAQVSELMLYSFRLGCEVELPIK